MIGKNRGFQLRGRVLGFTTHGVRLEWLEGVLAGREALVPRDFLIAAAVAAPLLVGHVEPAKADAVSEIIEDQRISEQDDVSLPSERDAYDDVLDELVAQERCVERAEEIGLSPEAAEAWCDR